MTVKGRVPSAIKKGGAVTIFDKYGGVPTIRLIVKAFYKQVLSRA